MDKRAAAEYLVEQTRLAAEERQFLINENETLHFKLQDVQNELMMLQRETQVFMDAKQGMIYGSDPNVTSLQRMIQRVEELEDLTHELKAQHNAHDLVETKTLLLEKEKELELYRRRTQDLLEKKKTLKALFDEEDLYTQFKKQLQAKDELIKDLRVELQRGRNSKMMTEITTPAAAALEERKPIKSVHQSYEWMSEKDRWLEQRPEQVLNQKQE